MKTVTIRTYLEADVAAVESHVLRPALLNYVVAGLMKFRPIAPSRLPEKWTPGTYRVAMRAFHFLPAGWQNVRIEFPGPGDNWFMRDNGHGSIAKVWDHLIFIEREGNGTRYVDQIRIDAGALTWFVALYANLFYRHRQRRWRRLVRRNFAPISAPTSTD